MRWRRELSLVCILAAAACGGDDRSPDETSTPDAAGFEVTCGAATFDAGLLQGSPSASLPAGATEAVDDLGDPVIDPELDWIVAEESDTSVALIRELEQPLDEAGPDVQTHEVRAVHRAMDLPGIPDGSWRLASAGPCTPRRALDGGLGAADLSLVAKPSPDATVIDLLVHERACASARPADGRIEVIELVEGTDRVDLWIGVRPRPGDQECPGNPATPYTIELRSPLSDRAIVDAGIVPPRPVAVADAAG